MASTVQPDVGRDARLPVPPDGHEPPASECMAAILESLNTMKNGDFSVRLPVSWTGLAGRIADNFNEIVATNERMALELKRVGQAVGKEGRTRERIRLERRRVESRLPFLHSSAPGRLAFLLRIASGVLADPG